jgi:hypothetical protein
MTVLYTYRCAACSHHGEIRLDDDSHDGEHAACSVCGATATLEWDGGVTFDRAVPTVDELMSEAFRPSRHPRSAEYIAGVRAILAHRIEGVAIAMPYELGTCQADAWLAGAEEGKTIWRELPAAT